MASPRRRANCCRWCTTNFAGWRHSGSPARSPVRRSRPRPSSHEAYLRLVGSDPDRRWDGCGHFFAAAAEAMRRILVENARSKARQKRGGGLRRVDLADQAAPRSGRGSPRPRRRPEPAGGRRPGRGARWSSSASSPGWVTRRSRLTWASPSTSLARNGPTPGPGSATPSAADRVPPPPRAAPGRAITDSRTVPCRSTRSVSRPCSGRPSNMTPSRTGPPSWTVSAATDAELRRRVEALLVAHDQADSLLDRPIVGPAGHGIVPFMRPEDHGFQRTEAESLFGASEGSDPTIDRRPDADAHPRRRCSLRRWPGASSPPSTATRSWASWAAAAWASSTAPGRSA